MPAADARPVSMMTMEWLQALAAAVGGRDAATTKQ